MVFSNARSSPLNAMLLFGTGSAVATWPHGAKSVVQCVTSGWQPKECGGVSNDWHHVKVFGSVSVASRGKYREKRRASIISSMNEK
ncbi:hypothetical protein EDB85DRAFT_2039943 [Lactarius pseudohatsudake]|nr:hypothetical protein EDB85DRAFT_2039943 [Lactarius pseudohatsudake]